MRLGLLFAVMVLALGMSHAVAQPSAPERRVLTFAYDVNETWPWHLGLGTVPAEMPGLSLEFLEETARRLDFDIRTVRVPFRRALAMLKEGEVDGVFEASFRPERLEYGTYPLKADGDPDDSRSMFIQSYVFYVRHDEDRIKWDGRTIGGVTGMIGVLRNTSAASDLTARDYPVFEVGDNVRALEMLAAGRLDVVLLLDNIGTAVFSRDPNLGRSLRTLTPPWDVKPYYLMLSHKLVEREPDFARALWTELAKVARSPFAAKRVQAYEKALHDDRQKAWGNDPGAIPPK